MRFNRDAQQIREWIRSHRKAVAAGVGIVGLTTVITLASSAEDSRLVIRSEGVPDFKNASILGNPGENVLQGEQTLFTRQTKQILDAQKQLQEQVATLRTQLSQLQPGPSGAATPAPTPTPITSNAALSSTPQPSPTGAPTVGQAHLGPPPEEFQATHVRDTLPSSQAAPDPMGFRVSGVNKRGGRPGNSIVSFPVKTSGAAYLKRPSIALPTGSYDKAKLLTGVEAPEGKSYPALLQLDFAFVIPNHKRLDLAGCFAIAKAQGDLSTERVQMQAVKLSCVSKKGGFFEREINGFIADDADNSFAVVGSVNTKQDRVAAMAFLASVVSGVSKAVQQAQTTQQATPLGGGQSIVTGDQAKFIGAGGAADAASQVTQWYLKQAQNLLPTINVGSGQDVWIVMQDSVDLPKDYFAQNGNEGGENASIYSYFTRILE